MSVISAQMSVRFALVHWPHSALRVPRETSSAIQHAQQHVSRCTALNPLPQYVYYAIRTALPALSSAITVLPVLL